MMMIHSIGASLVAFSEESEGRLQLRPLPAPELAEIQGVTRTAETEASI